MTKTKVSTRKENLILQKINLEQENQKTEDQVISTVKSDVAS